MTEVVKRGDYKNFTYKIYNDDLTENPYDEGALGTIYHWHRRGFTGEDYSQNREELETLIEVIKLEGGVVLPLYLYDHSGWAVNTTGFSCPWDSGQVGYIAVSKETIKSEFSEAEITEEDIKTILKDEVKTLNHYFQGEVYQFDIYDEEANLWDSCNGFIDDLDEVEKLIKLTIDYQLIEEGL